MFEKVVGLVPCAVFPLTFSVAVGNGGVGLLVVLVHEALLLAKAPVLSVLGSFISFLSGTLCQNKDQPQPSAVAQTALLWGYMDSCGALASLLLVVYEDDH